jgi:transketolase
MLFSTSFTKLPKKDPSVFFMTADMGAFSLDRFRRDFPERFINVGIAEQNLVSVAAGMALEGKKVFIYAIIPFITLRCLEQIKVDLCVMNLPVTIVGAGAGFTYSSDGPTHHAIEDVSIMRALPGMTIYNPSDQMTAKTAARNAHISTGPVYVRLDKGIWPVLYQVDDRLSKGFALLREGTKLLIIATGCMTHFALQVAENICDAGINPGIVDLFRLKPVAEELVEIAQEYECVVSLEEHTLSGGMGGAVVELFADKGLMIPVKRLGIMDVYPEGYGDREWMLSKLGLNVASLSSLIKQVLQKLSCGVLEASRYLELSNEAVQTLGIADFSRLLGISEEAFSDEIREYIETTDFRFRILEGDARESILIETLNTIDSGELTLSGPHKQVVWERGWAENLSDFEQSGNDISTLFPKFIRKGKVMRLQGSFILPLNPGFETAMVRVMRDVLFRKYFGDVRSVFEFGCGTGLNLLDIARIFPGKSLYGLDWTQAACDIVNRLGKSQEIDLKGVIFDMYHPDPTINLFANDGVFTIGALEQLGNGFRPFLSFLCEKSPRICIHFETMDELYTDPTLSDYLIKRYSRARNYLNGFLTALRELEARGLAEILQIQRTFGGQYHEGYSFVVWRPLCRRM